MATHKSIVNTFLENAGDITPTSLSPLRRKSILSSKQTSAIAENDDEAERLARRRELNATSTPLAAPNTSDKRRSLGLGFLVNMPSSEMADRVSQCIKLGNENKINLKNAFSLEMIDFMTYMIKKKDDNMSNFQVASTSLDVSTKIYGFRVDGVHMRILNLVSGLDKQEKDNKAQSNDVVHMDTEDNNECPEKQIKKKRKKAKQRIFATVEALRTNVETDKPSLITMEADSQTIDTLYQVTLPHHANSGFYPHPYNDVIVDAIECKDVRDKGPVVTVSQVADFTQMEICPPLFYFDFQSWNADDELADDEPETHNESGFEFDLDASLPHENDVTTTGTNYFDIECTQGENVNTCARAPNQVENIVDFREVLSNTTKTKDSEYSFIQKNLNIHWAGPSHWKVTNFKKALSNSKIIETCRQAPVRRKKEIELCYDDEMISSIDTKFVPSHASRMHGRTAKVEWNEEILLLPPDKHYNIAQANKLYLHTITFKHPEDKREQVAAYLSDAIENSNYCNDDNVANDYPDIVNDECRETQGSEANNNNAIRCEDENMLGSQMPFTGGNLVTLPKLTSKSTITFSVRAKKIDMRQLKTSIWRCLTKNGNEGKINDGTSRKVEGTQQDTDTNMTDSKRFSVIYKQLPKILTKTNIEALSFPISFVSLLHLANEKTLKLTSPIDMSDLIVNQDGTH